MPVVARKTCGAVVLLLLVLLTAARVNLASNDRGIAVDPERNTRVRVTAHPAQLSYDYRAATELLWFRVSVVGRLSLDPFDFRIAIELGGRPPRLTNQVMVELDANPYSTRFAIQP